MKGLAVLIGLLSATSPAAAQLELRWSAPPGCPQRAEVLKRIRSLAGSSLAQSEELSAEGTISGTDGGYVLTLLVRDGPDVRKRVIESDSCANLGGAAAVTLAFLLGIEMDEETLASQETHGAVSGNESASDERAAGATENSEGAEQSDDQPAAARDAGSEATTVRDGVPDDAYRGKPSRDESAGVHGWAPVLQVPLFAADFGPLPRPMLGVGLGAGVRYAPWRVVGAGQLYAEQTVTAQGSATDLGAKVRQMRGGLAVCYGWGSTKLELSPCVGMTLRYVRARGFGQDVSPRTRKGLWPAPSAGVVGYWYASKSLAFFTGATGHVEVSRPHIVIDGARAVAKLAPVSASIAVGAEWIF